MRYMPDLARCAAMAVIAVLATISSNRNAAAEDMNVRFSWKLKGEYGFFYLGKKKDLYKEAGLDLKLGEGAGSQAALGALIQGQEQAVILPGIFAISAIQKGMPVKIIALYQPETPVVLISHPDKPVLTPKDLEGKTIATSVGETGTSYLDVFCEVNKIDCNKISKIQMDSQSRVPQFLQKKVDVVSVYRSNDLPVLESKLGKFPILDLTEYGLVVPGLAVVASNDGIKKKAAALKSFLAATGKAIEMTRANPNAATTAIKEYWQAGPSDEIILQQIDAASVSMKSSSGKPAGWIDEKAVAGAVKLISATEKIGDTKPLSTFYTNELLPQ